MKKILYISGSRADYGLIRETLLALKKKGFQMQIGICGMHYLDMFGRSITEVAKDGFPVHRLSGLYPILNQGILDRLQTQDKPDMVLSFIGRLIEKLRTSVKEIKPNFILLLGDRPEMLAGAIVGAYLSIPVAHIHGGDVSSTVDEIARHSITKLSHLHFPATQKSAERIIKMGEDEWRVHIVGAPGLDAILKQKLPSREQIAQKYHLDLSRPVLLVLQHPVTLEWQKAGFQMEQTMRAIKDLAREIDFEALVIYPNADPGSRQMIKMIEKYGGPSPVSIYKNIPRNDFLAIMKISSVMLGNSSSGIIEAPSFHLPVINIGSRQQGRERAENIIDVDYNKEQIKKAIKKALFDEKFKIRVKKCKNPYGDGKAGERIAKILANVKIDKKLLDKKISY